MLPREGEVFFLVLLENPCQFFRAMVGRQGDVTSYCAFRRRTSNGNPNTCFNQVRGDVTTMPKARRHTQHTFSLVPESNLMIIGWWDGGTLISSTSQRSYRFFFCFWNTIPAEEVEVDAAKIRRAFRNVFEKLKMKFWLCHYLVVQFSRRSYTDILYLTKWYLLQSLNFIYG